MAEIPKGLGDMEALLKRAEKAKEIWELWRSLHQEAFEFAAPQRDTFRVWAPGQRKNRHVFDSTAIDGLVTFANRLQGSLVPSWQEWMKLVAGSEIPEEEKDRTNEGLELATDTFFSHLDHSNFSTEITPAFSDLGIGTGAIMIEEGPFDKPDESVFQFSNIPLAELHPELPDKGAIKSVWRPQETEARHINTLWPDADIPQKLQAIIDKDPHQKIKILNAMLWNPDDSLYHQLVIHKECQSLLFAQSFRTKRIIVFRWHVTPGEVFGRGPILTKLPDIRTVNKVKQFILENAAIQIAGIYTGRDDGVFNPYTVRITPGIVLPVQENGTRNPSLQALPRAGDIGLGGIILEDLQNGIKKALLSDPLGEVTDPVKSATEQILRNQESLKDRGASFGRMKSELVGPLVAAGVDILQSQGRLPQMRVDGKQVDIKHASPLAKAEELEDFQNSQVWFSNVAQLPQEIIAGTVKVEELPKFWQEKLGVPASLVRDDAERQTFGNQILQAAQQGLGQGIEG